MRGCAGFPSYLKLAAVAYDDGGWNPAYPVANVLDKVNISTAAVSMHQGDRQFGLSWGSMLPVQFLAFVATSARPFASFTVELFNSLPLDPSANAGGIVYQDTQPFFPSTFSVPGYPIQTRPYLMTAPVGAIGVRVTLSNNASTPWSIGALEVGMAYLWPDLAVEMSRGFSTQSQRMRQPGGLDFTIGQFRQRMFSGARNGVARAEIESTVLDFQKEGKLGNPFVFVRDIDDPTTWVREAFLARNTKLNASTQTNTDLGKQQIELVEHFL